MSDGDAEDAMYIRGADDARKFWIQRCTRKIYKLDEERKKVTSPNLVSYADGFVDGVAWALKQAEVDRYIDPKPDNEDGLVPPWNSLP